jgi:spermidine synthase
MVWPDAVSPRDMLVGLNVLPRRPQHAQAIDLAPATVSEFEGVRYLHLDSPWVQGAMRIGKPQAIELDYVQRMMAWMLWRPAEALGGGHAVQLGLGAGSITRFCHKRLRMQTTAVEINPSVIGMCRLWFHLPADDRRLTVLNDDAAHWLADPARLQTVQVLQVDLYDHEAAAPVLDDEVFYRACRAVLVDADAAGAANGGLMTVNLFGRDASFEASVQRIARAFGAGQVWNLRPTREGNTVVVAGRGVALPDRATLVARAANIEARFGLPARKWLRMIRTPLLPSSTT